MTALEAAWQAALAAEHQAVFGYALLGPQLSGAELALAVTCSDAHESLRDATAAALADAGFQPVPPETDYPALYPVAGAPAARRLAIRLEEDEAAAWRYLYLQAASTAQVALVRSVRRAAQAALVAAAVRATQWRAIVDPTRATTPFPGT